LIHPFVIWTVALFEARLLWRSWAFGLTIGAALLYLIFLDVILNVPATNPPHFFRSLSGSLPLINVRLLSMALGLISTLLATEFVKRDRQQDTIETSYVHSYSNLDYVLGKVFGVGWAFLFLQLVILAAVAVIHRFFVPLPFAWQPYVLYTLFGTLPTLAVTIGLSVLLVTILRSQALVFVLMVGLALLCLIVLGHRYHYYFDILGFHIPMMWSDFVGLGNLEQLIQVRGTHLLFGVACVAATALLSRRLRQSRSANLLAAVVVVSCLGGATWLSMQYWAARAATTQVRAQMRELSALASTTPMPSAISYDLQVDHQGRQIAVEADLILRAPAEVALDTLLLTLNPGLRVEELTIDDEPASFTRDHHLLRVHLAQSLAAADSCRLKIRYRGQIDERFCYLDIESERLASTYRIMLLTIPKRYAFVTPDYLHLTAEAAWYPLAGVPPGVAFPLAGQRDFATYRLRISVPTQWTAFSQGAVQIDSVDALAHYDFQTESPIPQASLTAGVYEQRELTVGDVSYRLAVRPGHTYFDSYLDSVSAVLPELIEELRNGYEVDLGLTYPYPRLSLVEVPIQIFAFRRLWTTAQESVQPEIVFLPEMGTTCDGCDFGRMKRRSRRSQEWANQAESAATLQSDYLRTFVMVDLLKMRDPGRTNLNRNGNLETGWELLPNYVAYQTNLTSPRWPLLNYAVEAYFRDRVTPPANVEARRWTGMTDVERANLILQEFDLSQLLAELDEQDPLRTAAIQARGRQLLQLFAAAVGTDAFGQRLTEWLETHRHRTTSEVDLLTFATELGMKDPASVIDSWYRTTQLPGYELERYETYQVLDGERTRTQVELDLTNPTTVDGVVEVSFRFRDDSAQQWWQREEGKADYSQMVSMPQGTRKKLRILLQQPAAELKIDTYVSRNIPALIQIPFEEATLRRDAVAMEDERSEMLADDPTPAKIEYVVDNEDPGFEVIAKQRPNWLRRAVVDLFDLQDRKVPYVRMSWWDAPGTWEATTDQSFYGRFVQSGRYKRAGDGRSGVAWQAEVERAGDYDLFYFCGPLEAIKRQSRHQRGDSQLSFRVHHEEGAEEMVFDLADAQQGWNALGTFRLASGPARVELSDLAGGRIIVADAIKWVERK
jgi:hypothetical protein